MYHADAIDEADLIDYVAGRKRSRQWKRDEVIRLRSFTPEQCVEYVQRVIASHEEAIARLAYLPE